ncbi:MAG TPA: hypothetical protein VL651_07080 [Bacteroidia bacterium]|nr:hypothetical protein [Bacteroidia bacterium]
MKRFISFYRRIPKWRRRFLNLFLFCLLLFLFRAPIYRTCFSYSLVGDRGDNSHILAREPSVDNKLVRQIIDRCLDSTSALLSFTTSSCKMDAASLISGGETNCVGYAALFAAQCNGVFKHYGIYNRCRAEIHITEIHCFGFNIHHAFSSPFWKNHDAVRIINNTDQQTFLIDPTLYDFCGIGYVSERKN